MLFHQQAVWVIRLERFAMMSNTHVIKPLKETVWVYPPKPTTSASISADVWKSVGGNISNAEVETLFQMMLIMRMPSALNAQASNKTV